MRTPLNDVLENKASHLSFHTPAHNGGIVIDSRHDITELSFSDNLLEAESVILESEKEVARAYSVENVLYSTAGATALIHTVIRALRVRGDFLIYGNAHKSVYNALRINAPKAWLYRGTELREALSETQAKVVICTSPDYFGKVLDLAEIRKICDEFGAVLVVDASHGAHFAFSSILPNSATEFADLVIHSQHKTMATLTGGASLCYKDGYKKEILRAFREIHTTSPNYLIMGSIESAVKLLSERGEELYKKVAGEIELFSEKCNGKHFRVIPTDDKTRLVIEVDDDGDTTLRGLESLNIYPETVYGNKLVFIVTPFNYHNLDNLFDALDSLSYKGKGEEVTLPRAPRLIPILLSGECEEVPLDEAVDRVAYGEVGLYPPGVPVVVAGERYTKEKTEFLKEHVKFAFGLEKGCALVLKLK